MVGFEDRKPFLRSSGDQHFIAAMGKDRGTELPELRIIFDQQDRLRASFNAAGAVFRASRSAGWSTRGK